jgi:ATP-binding cassette, subfamily G (WHITE), member 2, SNQ2
LEFALSTKTPGKRLPGVSGHQFNKELMSTVLKMLSITHTRDTLVGNEFIRGISGGEKKRLSIAEMMATRAHVVSYDNSTRGLDASTAVSY